MVYYPTTNHYVCISSDAVYRYKSSKEKITKEYTKITGVNPFNYKSDLYNGPIKNVKSIRLVEYFINFPSEYRPFANDDSLETLEDILNDKHNTIETVMEKYKEGQITNNTAVKWLMYKIEHSDTQLQINQYKTILENLTTIQQSYRNVTDTDDQYGALFTPNSRIAYLSHDINKGWYVSATSRSIKVPIIILDQDPIVSLDDGVWNFNNDPTGEVGEDLTLYNSSGAKLIITNPSYARNRIYTNVAEKFPCFVLKVNNINNGYIFNDTPNIFEIIPYYRQTGTGYKHHQFTESFGTVIKSIHIHIVDQHGDELPKSLSSAGGANWWMFEITTLDASDISR